MSTGTVRGTDAREFVKAFDAICNWNNGWERWNDAMSLFAIELSNPVDLNNREEREAEYIRIRQKYTDTEFDRFGNVLTILVDSLERNPFQDFLGTMYMQLDMGSKMHGQCFTPFSLCQAMAKMAMPEEVIRERLDRRGWLAINDCACGAGATLIAAAERLHELGINYQQKALFVAGDIDTTVAKMCYVQLSLLGCPGRVRIGDSLMNPETGDILIGEEGSNTWRTPMFYTETWFGRILARKMDMVLGALRPKEEPEKTPEKATETPEKPKTQEKDTVNTEKPQKKTLKTLEKTLKAEKEENHGNENGGIQLSFFDFG